MKEIMPKPIITMEVFKDKSSKVKNVKPTIKQPLTKGQRNLMNVIEQQLTKQFNNNPKFSLLASVLIKYKVYRIIAKVFCLLR
jgi:hypothetical protein